MHGASGSLPVSSPDRLRYGGRTTCFTVDSAVGEAVIFDCGTGLTQAPDVRLDQPTHFHVFLTHYHLDHLLGLLLFRPLYMPDHRFTFYGRPPEGLTLEEAVAGAFAAPWFPVELATTEAEKVYVTLDGDPIDVGRLTVTYETLNHPQGVLGYRIQHDGGALVIATDHEGGVGEIDSRLVSLARDAEVLIHDAQYTPEDYAARRQGWGHSTWRHAVEAAREASVRRLVLTSHDPFHTDAEIDAVVAAARARFGAVDGAHEGMLIGF